VVVVGAAVVVVVVVKVIDDDEQSLAEVPKVSTTDPGGTVYSPSCAENIIDPIFEGTNIVTSYPSHSVQVTSPDVPFGKVTLYSVDAGIYY
jgi:hypothetical protein